MHHTATLTKEHNMNMPSPSSSGRARPSRQRRRPQHGNAPRPAGNGAPQGGHRARAPLVARRPGLRAPGDWERETIGLDVDRGTPRAWRPWHAYAVQHLRMANHG